MSNLRWLQLDIFNYLHVRLGGHEATDSDMRITYREGVMPYDHSTDLNTNFDLGVRVIPSWRGVGAGGADQRRLGR
jgi:hypothetical protein